MHEYDFKSLNDKEFEILSTDILSSILGQRIERFKPGRDSGVDGRFFNTENDEIVIQCKHWTNTPISQLIRALQTKELPKVKLLNPKRYILVVSNSLSRANKEAIKNALHPHVKSQSDILGKEDLNDAILKNKQIELRHYKLWANSTEVTNYLLNKAIFDRSAYLLEEAIIAAKTYAVTSNHEQALEKLKNLGVIIITGEPGIGKTTLAEQICLIHAAEDYEIIKISEEISEAEAVYETDKNQLFYFDDFLGRNYLEALSGHEGAHIVNFIKRVNRDKRNKRFVVTSRSTILNQGKLLIDLFRNYKIDRNEYELSASRLTELDKAKILYSQMWHSGLPSAHIDTIYDQKRYREIIKHRNFNPRLIRFILDPDRIQNICEVDYWSHIKTTLNNPSEIWENPFDVQQDDFARAITLLVALNGRSINETELSEGYARYISLPESANLKGRRDFLANIKHLTGSLLNRRLAKPNEVALIDLFNPSLGDYLLSRYSNDTPTLRLAFLSLRSLSSLKTLTDLTNNKILLHQSGQSIFASILEQAHRNHFLNYTPEYISKIITESTIKEPNKQAISGAIEFIATAPIEKGFYYTTDAIRLALSWELISADRANKFIVKACDEFPEHGELERLLALYADLKETGIPLEVTQCFLEEAIVSYFNENIHEEIEDSDVFGSVDYSDLTAAQTNLTNTIEERLSSIGVTWELDSQSIVDAYDIYSRRDHYFIPDSDESEYPRPRQMDHVDQIDDLFSRD